MVQMAILLIFSSMCGEVIRGDMLAAVNSFSSSKLLGEVVSMVPKVPKSFKDGDVYANPLLQHHQVYNNIS